MREKNRMSREEIDLLLQEAVCGVLCTTGADGYPYALPLQFAYIGGKIYFHCAMQGEKTDNIIRDGRVCFTVYRDNGFVYQKEAAYACGVNTMYECVVVRGQAKTVGEGELKNKALHAIVKKCAPELYGKPLKEASLHKTCVVEINPVNISGKKQSPK